MSAWISLLLTGAVIVVLGAILVRVRKGVPSARGPRGLAGFLRHFDPDAVSEDVVVEVYRQLERWDGPLAPLPDDDLRARFGLLDAEVAQAVAQVARACGREPGDARHVRTIGDWVRHVSESPPADAPPKA